MPCGDQSVAVAKIEAPAANMAARLRRRIRVETAVRDAGILLHDDAVRTFGKSGPGRYRDRLTGSKRPIEGMARASLPDQIPRPFTASGKAIHGRQIGVGLRPARDQRFA